MLRLGITTIPPRSSNQHTNVTAWAFVVKPPLLRPVSSWYPPFLPRWHAGGLWSWCCPSSALFRPPNPAPSGLWGYLSSHTPAFVQARNQLYTLCHGPNRSGRSRHGIPVFSQYRMALSISRLLFLGRPPCGFFSGGNLSLILFHCCSLISCLFMCFILSSLHFVLNI